MKDPMTAQLYVVAGEHTYTVLSAGNHSIELIISRGTREHRTCDRETIGNDHLRVSKACTRGHHYPARNANSRRVGSVDRDGAGNERAVLTKGGGGPETYGDTPQLSTVLMHGPFL